MAENEVRNTQEDFEEFRSKVHPQHEEGRAVVPHRRPVALAYDIFMMIVYIGVGVLLLINFFNWTTLEWARYVIGILLIVYGLFRAFRQFAGKSYYR